MSYEALHLLNIAIQEGVAVVMTDPAPLDLIDESLLLELGRLRELMGQDKPMRVIVFQSADPHFSWPHIDGAVLERSKQLKEKPSALPLCHFSRLPSGQRPASRRGSCAALVVGRGK